MRKVLGVSLQSVILLVIVIIVLYLVGFLHYQSKHALLASSNDEQKSVSIDKKLLLPESYNHPPISFAFLGDMNFARTGGYVIESTGASPFEHVEDELQKYDIVVGNLETNISTPGVGLPRAAKSYTFNSPLISIEMMSDIVDVVSLANNHTMDYGGNALLDQMNHLDQAHIVHFGAGENISEAFAVKYYIYDGVVFGFVGVNEIESWYQDATKSSPGSAFFSQEKLYNSIKESEKNADYTIVFAHWGWQYFLESNNFQKEWGRLFVDWGADVVIGAHPHVLQEDETYKGVTIYYSLGNFIFSDFDGIPHTNESYILVLNAQNGVFEEVEKVPVTINSNGFPEVTN